MRIYLKSFILSLAKGNKDIMKSSFIPVRLRQIEREMEKGSMTADDVLTALKSDKYLKPAFSEGDWKMIEKEVRKMVK